jgi:hypothetical protein
VSILCKNVYFAIGQGSRKSRIYRPAKSYTNFRFFMFRNCQNLFCTLNWSIWTSYLDHLKVHLLYTPKSGIQIRFYDILKLWNSLSLIWYLVWYYPRSNYGIFSIFRKNGKSKAKPFRLTLITR